MTGIAPAGVIEPCAPADAVIVYTLIANDATIVWSAVTTIPGAHTAPVGANRGLAEIRTVLADTASTMAATLSDSSVSAVCILIL